MSYEKHNWVNGETITDTLLNRMEDGIASASSGGLLVWIYTEGFDMIFDKTAREVLTALENGTNVTFTGESDDDYETIYFTLIRSYNSEADTPGFLLLSFDVVSENWEQRLFSFDDMDGYPTFGGLS